MSAVLEVEIDGELNETLFFLPLQRRIRGRFDINRCGEPLARLKSREWPMPIPGQRLGINTETGEAYVAEPLQEPVNAAILKQVERVGRVGPAVEPVANVHLATWLFWIKRAVESGIARITKGELPKRIDGEPQLAFITRPPVSSNDRLAEAIEANTKVMSELMKRLVK